MTFVPLYEQIKERIRAELLTTCDSGTEARLPTERELEAHYKVSRPTISKALAALAAEGLLVKEQGRGNFTRSPLLDATNRVGGQHGEQTARRNIGLWITIRPGGIHPASLFDTDWNSIAVMRGVQQARDPKKHRIFVSSPPGETLEADIRSEALELTRMAQDSDMDGLILWYNGGVNNLPILERLRERGIPMVFLDRKPPNGFDADFVGIDHRRSARDMVRHLRGLGHKRIAHITNPEQVSTVAEAHAGYIWGLEEADIPFRADYVLTGNVLGLAVGDHADALAARLMTLPGPPTAVFAITDFIALQLIAALRKRGVRVPEQMAVAGIENLEQWSPGHPILTTVHPPFERMGEEALHLIVMRLRNRPPKAYRHVLLDAPLIARESTLGRSEKESQ